MTLTEWEGQVEKTINYWLREYLSTPKTNDRYEALLEMNEPFMIKDIIGIIHQIIASELAKEIEKILKIVISGKKASKSKIKTDKWQYGFYSACQKHEIIIRDALTEVAKKVREKP